MLIGPDRRFPSKRKHQEKMKRRRDSTKQEEEEERVAKKVFEEGTRCKEEQEEDIFKAIFDFPWLKEGMMISTPKDDRGLEGTFLSSLHDIIPGYNSDGIEFPDQFPLWIPESLPEDNVVVNERGWSFKGDNKLESFDCIWSSLLNYKPL